MKEDTPNHHVSTEISIKNLVQSCLMALHPMKLTGLPLKIGRAPKRIEQLSIFRCFCC